MQLVLYGLAIMMMTGAVGASENHSIMIKRNPLLPTIETGGVEQFERILHSPKFKEYHHNYPLSSQIEVRSAVENKNHILMGQKRNYIMSNVGLFLSDAAFLGLFIEGMRACLWDTCNWSPLGGAVGMSVSTYLLWCTLKRTYAIKNDLTNMKRIQQIFNKFMSNKDSIVSKNDKHKKL